MGDEQMEDEDHMETDSTEEVTRKKRNRGMSALFAAPKVSGPDSHTFFASHLISDLTSRITATAPDPDAMSHLPLYAQYLLLASFLASYNPTRLDVRYFLRDDALMGSSHGRRPDGARRRRPVKRRKTADGEQGEGQSLVSELFSTDTGVRTETRPSFYGSKTTTCRTDNNSSVQNHSRSIGCFPSSKRSSLKQDRTPLALSLRLGLIGPTLALAIGTVSRSVSSGNVRRAVLGCMHRYVSVFGAPFHFRVARSSFHVPSIQHHARTGKHPPLPSSSLPHKRRV